jgi:hypothetical protein
MPSCWVIYKEIEIDGSFACSEESLAVFMSEDTARGQILAYEGDDVKELPLDVFIPVPCVADKSIFKVFRMTGVLADDKVIYGATRLNQSEIDWKIYRLAERGRASNSSLCNAADSPEIPLPLNATRENPYEVRFCYAFATDEQSAIKAAIIANGKRNILQREVVEYIW